MNIIFFKSGCPVLKRSLINQESIIIGRADDCDVSLIEDEISKKHCELKKIKNTWFIKNISKLPIFVNEQEANEEIPLRAGDRFKIGSFDVWFGKNIESNVDTNVSFANPTKILNNADENDDDFIPNINIVIPPDPPHTFLLKNEITIGKHKDCKVKLNDPYVSRWHANIYRKGSSVFLQDTGSSNGTFLNGHRISTAGLQKNGEILVGKTIIKFRIENRFEKEKQNSCSIIGKNPKIKFLIKQIEKISPTTVSICLIGESGTGKELFAKYVHDQSLKKEKPFIAVNCGAIPQTLAESIFFGHERGAFTGAIESVAGVFEQANGGTLFLDEIAEISLEMQTRLLRVLETKEVKRLGSSKTAKVDFRLISATNKDLPLLVAGGKFRDDLFHRIFVMPIKIPPLRDRNDDIELIAKHFLREFSPSDLRQFSSNALRKLTEYSWPGNVRELRNTIQRSLVCCSNYEIDENDIMIYKMPSVYDDNYKDNDCLRNNERALLVEVLQKFEWNISKASSELGIARSTLRSKIKKYNIK